MLQRLRRLNSLLVTIAFIFAICWMPLNVYNLVLDVYNPFQGPEDQETMLVIYAVCHMLGMSSACANPWLYGWYNDNFRNEFRDIVGPVLRCCCPSAMANSLSLTSSTSAKQRGGPHLMQNQLRLVVEDGVDGTSGAASGEMLGHVHDYDCESPSRLTNNIPLASTLANALTCEVEVTLIDSSCVQQLQNSPML